MQQFSKGLFSAVTSHSPVPVYRAAVALRSFSTRVCAAVPSVQSDTTCACPSGAKPARVVVNSMETTAASNDRNLT